MSSLIVSLENERSRNCSWSALDTRVSTPLNGAHRELGRRVMDGLCISWQFVSGMLKLPATGKPLPFSAIVENVIVSCGPAGRYPTRALIYCLFSVLRVSA